MKRAPNILFDFGNVILDIDIPAAKERLHALKSEEIDSATFDKKVKELVFAYEVDAIPTDEFLESVSALAREDVTHDDVVAAWNSMLVGLPAFRLGMLESLRHDHTLLLLSNTNHLHISWVHEHLDQVHGVQSFENELMHDAYYSHLIKKRKPTKEAFEHVIDDAMITPHKTLFIDDMPQNIEVAKKMGFQTLLSPPEVEVAETLKVLGYY